MALSLHKDIIDYKVLRLNSGKAFSRKPEHCEATCVEFTGDITFIHSEVLKDFFNLRKVILPPSVKYIGDRAFEGCTHLREIDLPDGLIGIGNGVFKDCRSLYAVNLPSSLDFIGQEAFCHTALQYLALPASLTEIGESAFADCEHLTEITGGEGLKSIADSAFLNCRSLERFAIPATVTYLSPTAFDGTDFPLPATVYNPRSVPMPNPFRLIVPEGTVTLPAHSVYTEELHHPDRVILPNSVRQISSDTFYPPEVSSENGPSQFPGEFRRFIPRYMTMPRDYMRQKSQFDALTGLALCATVWRKWVQPEDYASVILYQNDPSARWLASQKLRKQELSVLLLERLSDNDPLTLRHIAEYYCTVIHQEAYRCRTADSPRVTIHMLAENFAKRLERSKAYDALDLLERRCMRDLSVDHFFHDSVNALFAQVSPFEANCILNLVLNPFAKENSDVTLSSEGTVLWKGRHGYAPAVLLRSIAAAYCKPKLLRRLSPSRVSEYALIESADAAAALLDAESYSDFCKANQYLWEESLQNDPVS